MNFKKLSIGVLIVAAVAVGSWMLKGGSTPVTVNTPPSGSVVGPDLFVPYFNVNNVRSFYYSSTARAATTTICAFQSPAATTTVAFASVKFTVSSTTGATARIAKATTAYATTTLLATETMAANAQTTIMASTTPTTYGATIIAPSNWIVYSMEGGAGTFSPTATCKLVLTEN